MNKHTKKAVIALILVTVFGLVARAETSYCLNGKSVTAGEATKAAMKTPSAQIIKVQVTRVALNDETMRLKKSSDVKLSNPCNLK